MKRFARNIIAVLCVAACWLNAGAVDYTTETLHYDVVYHWGMIWKHAADATLSIRKTSTGYYSQLTGKTRSWADKVYPTRDTLKCTMNSKMQPLKYEKLTHEKNYYARDVVNFSYNYSNTSANCVRYREGSEPVKVSLSAKCQAYDMVSVFYMLRGLEYDKLTANKPITTIIFSGKRKEQLTIRFKGKENVKMRDGTKREAYHITFKFTQEGGKKSSDDIDAYMSTDARRIPLLLVGHLPVGEVKCYYKS